MKIKNNSGLNRFVLVNTVVILFITLWGIQFAHGLDLVSAYQLALENDNRYAATGNEFKSAQQRLSQAKRLYLPDVRLTYERTDTDQTIVQSQNDVFGQGESSFPTDDIGLALTQPIFRWDLIVAKRKARNEVRAAELDYLAEEQNLILRTAEVYMKVLSTLDNLGLSRKEAAILEEHLTGAERRFDVGIADATEVYESKARFEFTNAEVIEAENSFSDSREELSVITGQEATEYMILVEEYPLLPPEPNDVNTWLAEAQEKNLRIQAKNQLVEVAYQEIKRIRSDRFPELNLVINSGTRTTEGSLFGGGSEVETTDVVLLLEIPLFQRGQVKPKTREATFQWEIEKNEAEELRRNIRRSTRSSFLGVLSGISKVSALMASVESQEKNLDAKQSSFDAGTSNNIEVLDAQRDLYLANRDLSGAYYQYIVSTLRLKELTARLTEADLEYINQYLVAGHSN